MRCSFLFLIYSQTINSAEDLKWLVNSKNTRALLDNPTLIKNLYPYISISSKYDSILNDIISFTRTLSTEFYKSDSDQSVSLNSQLDNILLGLKSKSDVHFVVDPSKIIENLIHNLQLYSPLFNSETSNRRKRSITNIGSLLNDFISSRTTVKLQTLQIVVSNLNYKEKLVFLERLRSLNIIEEYRIPMSSERNKIDTLLSKIFNDKITHLKTISNNDNGLPDFLLERINRKRKTLQSNTVAPIHKRTRGDSDPDSDDSTLEDDVFETPLSPKLSFHDTTIEPDVFDPQLSLNSMTSSTNTDDISILDFLDYIRDDIFLKRNVREAKFVPETIHTKLTNFHSSLNQVFDESTLQDPNNFKANVVLSFKQLHSLHQHNTKTFYFKSVLALLDDIEKYTLANITSPTAVLVQNKYHDLRFNIDTQMLEKYPITQKNVTQYLNIFVCLDKVCLTRYSEIEIYIKSNSTIACTDYLILSNSQNIYCKKEENLDCENEIFESTTKCPLYPLLYKEYMGKWTEEYYTIRNTKYLTEFSESKRLELITKYFPVNIGIQKLLQHKKYNIYLLCCNILTLVVFLYHSLKRFFKIIKDTHSRRADEQRELQEMRQRVNLIFNQEYPNRYMHGRAVPALNF